MATRPATSPPVKGREASVALLGARGGCTRRGVPDNVDDRVAAAVRTDGLGARGGRDEECEGCCTTDDTQRCA